MTNVSMTHQQEGRWLKRRHVGGLNKQGECLPHIYNQNLLNGYCALIRHLYSNRCCNIIVVVVVDNNDKEQYYFMVDVNYSGSSQGEGLGEGMDAISA